MTKPIILRQEIIDNLLSQLKIDETIGEKRLDDLLGTVHCLDVLTYLRQFPDKCADFILTDEPYGIPRTVYTIGMPDGSQKDHINNNFKWENELPLHLIIPWVFEAYRVLKDDGVLVNCGVVGWSTTYENVCALAGFDFKAHNVWVKTTSPYRHAKGGFRSAHEVLFVAVKGSLRHRMKKVEQSALMNWKISTVCPECGHHHDVINKASPKLLYENYSEYGGPYELISHLGPFVHHSKRSDEAGECQKPDWLARFYIDLLTEPGEVGIDPFAGSGEFPVQMARMGRKWSCNDFSSQKVSIIRQRLAAIERESMYVTPGQSMSKLPSDNLLQEDNEEMPPM